MDQYGVDIAMLAHDHDYQRWVPLNAAGVPSPEGVTEFIVGEFQRRGHRVTVLGEGEGELAARCRDAGISFQPVRFGRYYSPRTLARTLTPKSINKTQLFGL